MVQIDLTLDKNKCLNLECQIVAELFLLQLENNPEFKDTFDR